MEENDCNATLLENELFEGLKVSVLDDGLQVVEPDVLVDISTIAACFQDYGHHPLAYLINRLKPMSNTAPILLGNFAGTALDQIIHDPAADFGDMLRTSFSEQALQFCTCEDFNPAKFKTDALHQVNNIREAVDVLFDEYDRDKALLEPSFVCKALGLRGRVDLMTSDMRLLVEQKSGKKWAGFREAHYVQVLLYYGVLRHNFQLDADSVDIRLLYSKYPASQGLLDVANNDTLFREAIHLRNLIVAMEMKIAREGFASVLPLLQPDVLLQRQEKSEFFHRYVRPEIERTLLPLRSLAAPELDYMERMVTFVFREQFAQRLAQDTDDELRRAELENANLHVANNVLDNCLSTLKHETMYYPSRIRQLVDAGDIHSLEEVTSYYRDLYAILIRQATDQVERIPLHVRPVELYGRQVLGDENLLRYLFELLGVAHPQPLPKGWEDGEKSETSNEMTSEVKDDNYVVFHIPLTSNRSSIPSGGVGGGLPLAFYLSRQIVRDHGEATNRRACGITISEHQIDITLPRYHGSV